MDIFRYLEGAGSGAGAWVGWVADGSLVNKVEQRTSGLLLVCARAAIDTNYTGKSAAPRHQLTRRGLRRLYISLNHPGESSSLPAALTMVHSSSRQGPLSHKGISDWGSPPAQRSGAV